VACGTFRSDTSVYGGEDERLDGTCEEADEDASCKDEGDAEWSICDENDDEEDEIKTSNFMPGENNFDESGVSLAATKHHLPGRRTGVQLVCSLELSRERTLSLGMCYRLSNFTTCLTTRV